MNIDKQDAIAASGSGANMISTRIQEPEKALGTDQTTEIAREKLWHTWLSPLWLCLLVALLIRIWLTVRTHGTLDGDEALLGIQAEHILQGERPIYFYGIPYFGSMEAYIAAFLFSIFGPSVAVLRAETTAFGLLLVSTTWWLAGLLAQAAKLPRYAKQVFIVIAALVAALPPVYDGIIELRTGGGWIESFVIMLLLLISVHRLTSRWHAGASWRELALRWAGVGLVVGFGIWIYPLVSIAILAAALWIIIDRLVEIVKLLKASEPLLLAIVRPLRGLLLALAALPTCVIGFTPGIIWGAENQWANLRYIFALGGGWTEQRVVTVASVSTRYAACVAPRVVSGATPLESTLLQAIHLPLLLLGGLCILFTLVLIVGSFRWQHPLLLNARRLALLPTLFGLCSAALYCTSSASVPILLSCNDDFGGRYASPLVLALPFFFATSLTILGMFLHERGTARNQQTAEIPAPTPAQPVHGISRQRFSRAAIVVLALVLVYLGGQSATYGLTNQDLAFQSAYCTIAPANYSPIITYMEQEHIQYAWGTNLLVYPISFETNNQIVVADPEAIIHPETTINRIPDYTKAVASADRASFLIFSKPGDQHPALLQLLDADHVTYKTAAFPSQPGVNVMVVTPLSRTVSPFESKSFDIFYCSI